MITAFYDGQVRLLKAFFAQFPQRNVIRFTIVDGSQGDEALVEIIDAVTFGGGADESTGILGGERRRFNVAVSRAMVGRIFFLHEDFSQDKHRSPSTQRSLKKLKTRYGFSEIMSSIRSLVSC